MDSIAIAIATMQRPGMLGALLSRLQELQLPAVTQAEPNVEILVVDNDPAESAREVIDALRSRTSSACPPSAASNPRSDCHPRTTPDADAKPCSPRPAAPHRSHATTHHRSPDHQPSAPGGKRLCQPPSEA
jgi:hypothetical protein